MRGAIELDVIDMMVETETADETTNPGDDHDGAADGGSMG